MSASPDRVEWMVDLVRNGEIPVFVRRAHDFEPADLADVLAALDEEAARDLLLAGLAAVPPDKDCRIDWITSAQQWAVRPLLDAGLILKPGGAVFLRGELGPLTPYLPSGAYL